MGRVDDPPQAVQVALVHAQVRQVQPAGLLVQEPHDDALALSHGKGGDPHVHGPAGDAQGDASVLGQALLGDIELRHDLDAGDERRAQPGRGLQDLAQDAVDAETDHQAALEGLDVDVRGLLLDRLRQQGVDQADDRGVVLGLHQVLRLRKLVGHAVQVHVVADALHGLRGLAGGALVDLAQEPLETLLVDALKGQRAAQAAAKLGDGRRPYAASVGHPDLACLPIEGNEAVAPSERKGHHLTHSSLTTRSRLRSLRLMLSRTSEAVSSFWTRRLRPSRSLTATPSTAVTTSPSWSPACSR